MPQHCLFDRYRAFGFASTALLLLTPAMPLCAQTLHGTLRTTAQGSPVAGAIIVLEDTLRVMQARARSDEQGRFVLRAAAPGRFSLRVQRIGVRPYESMPFELHGDTTVTIALNSLPFSLPRVVSRAVSACRAHGLETSAVWQVWEDVRTALLAASLTYSDKQHRFSVGEVLRLYDAHPTKLRGVALSQMAVTATQPWTSLAPDVLAQRGYVAFGDDRINFISPDLDVLLSRSFENTHCFEPTLAHDGAMIGLSFDPAGGLKNHTDIAGTFWLDAASHELQQLTFRHIGLPNMMGDSAGESRVRFATFGTQEWFIPEWIIRAPIPLLEAGNGMSRLSIIEQLRLYGDAVTGRDSRLFSWRMIGTHNQHGAVMAVYGPDGPHDTTAIWTGPTGAVRLAVTSRSPGAPAPVPADGADVALIGSTRQQLTDITGVATFAGLTTGDYMLEVNTIAYRLFSRAPETLTVHVEAGTITRAIVDTKSASALAFSKCGGAWQHLIAGAVYKDGAPVPAAHVAVYDSTLEGNVRVSTESPDHPPGSWRIATASTNALGRFVICVPHHFEPDVYDLRAYSGNNLETSGLVHFTGIGGIQAIDLILRPRRKESKSPARPDATSPAQSPPLRQLAKTSGVKSRDP
jgi:hypothetical protein